MEKKIVRDLPEIDPDVLKYYRDCADRVVERRHMCGGCLKGQFYCELFEKWRERYSSLQQDKG